jgi:hypothetical protein
MKTYFELEDNIIDKKLQKYIDDMTFSSKKNVKEVIKRIISCYAQNFCNGNEDKAKTLLMKENAEMRRKDSNLLHFFAGTLLSISIFTLFALLIPTTDPNGILLDIEELIFAMPVFRFVLVLIFGLGLISLDVYILRKYRVNYMFIFGLDPHYKVTHEQLIRTAMMLLSLWMLFFMIEVFMSKLQ